MQVSYRQFTANLFESFLSKRDEVLQIIASTSTVLQMINLLLIGKSYAYQYADFIDSRRCYKNIFQKLRNISKEISNSRFQEILAELKEEIDVKFEENDEELSRLILKSAISNAKNAEEKQRGNNSGIFDISKKENINQLSADFGPQQIPQRSNYFKKKQAQLPLESVERSQLGKNIKEVKVQDKQKTKIDKIDCKKISVEVKYLACTVDIEYYSYNGFKLKEALNKYIRKYLKENAINVLTKSSEVVIMEDIVFIKSIQAGNYRFNPFCDAVQIILRLKAGNFDNNFTIQGDVDKIEIAFKKIELAEWNKGSSKLTLKSSIRQLVEEVCRKRQTPDLAENLAKGLMSHGGANIIQDLFCWEKSDYSQLKVKTTYIFEIQELVEQIKSSSNLCSQKSLSKQKKQCLKTANSHKILRYVVYKTEGVDGAKKIAWLNMENLRNAINIVRKEIYNEQLLAQLEQYFNQFALDPDDKPIAFSRGLVLFGPPGTGKTVLTQALPNIMGFHLIEKGLSAADFMKSLVGQSSRMILSLVNRASYSPHLLCSVAIDEVDGLVPDRKDKDQKNKGEGISMLLSVIGGNKDVSNLVFMTSTNYLKKIDEAIRRRLSGQYQVGRPNPWARRQIITQKLAYIQGKEVLMEHMIKITANFTGAALGGLTTHLSKSLKLKKMNNQKPQITSEEITDAAILIAKQYSIKLGVYTLPQIFKSQADKKYIFTETFFSRIANRFLMVKYSKSDKYQIMYSNELKRYQQGKIIPFHQTEKDQINISTDIKKGEDFKEFSQFIESIFSQKKYDLVYFQADKKVSFKEYARRIDRFFADRKKNAKKRTIMIVQDHEQCPASINYETRLNQQKDKNLLIIYYLHPSTEITSISQIFFGSQIAKGKDKEKKQRAVQDFTGRIMVELNDESRMAFQLNTTSQEESNIAFKLFLKSKESSSPKAVIPELIDFFTKKEVSYILMIDYELLLQNDAFEEKKVLEVLQEKMMEAKNYERAAVIINLDSMIILNESASDSNFGRSLSYSVQNHNLYQIILNYMSEFAMVNEKTSRWMTVIAKHRELINIAKKSLSWPKYPEEIEEEKQEQAKDQERECIRCGEHYTERKNMEERKCKQHIGKIIDITNGTFEIDATIKQLKIKLLKRKGKSDKKQENPYYFACCFGDLQKQGCKAFYHINQAQRNTEEDELQMSMEKFAEKDEQILGSL